MILTVEMQRGCYASKPLLCKVTGCHLLESEPPACTDRYEQKEFYIRNKLKKLKRYTEILSFINA